MNGESLRVRALSKTAIADDGCVIWTGAKNKNGYGRVYAAGRVALAHRVVYELFNGPIPPGLTLDHSCGNRACVTPAHLNPMSLADNIRRGGNSLKTHCPQGHAYTPDNVYLSNGGRSRNCKTCTKRSARRRYWAQKER